jgi:hypothetical protein
MADTLSVFSIKRRFELLQLTLSAPRVAEPIQRHRTAKSPKHMPDFLLQTMRGALYSCVD